LEEYSALWRKKRTDPKTHLGKLGMKRLSYPTASPPSVADNNIGDAMNDANQTIA
jgi:hypothetical protein